MHVKDVIEELRIARRKAGITQPQLAKKMGYSADQLSDWESGKTTPRLQQVYDWAEALGFLVELSLCRLTPVINYGFDEHGAAFPIEPELN